MYKQLIFDCDGVLVDSEIIAAQVMVAALNKYHIPIDEAYYLHHCTGKTFSGLIHSLSEAYNVSLPDDFITEVTTLMEAAVAERLQPVPGMKNLLSHLNHIPKVVVSNSDIYQIENALKLTRLDQFFDQYFSSEQVENPKPSPDVYLYATHKLNIRPEDCLVIEDSVSGATAAISAGMEVIGLLAGAHIVAGHEDRLRAVGVRRFATTGWELQNLLYKTIGGH